VGLWSGGRHVRGNGYTKDCEKYNAASILGYIVLRYTADMIRADIMQIIFDIKLAIDTRALPNITK